MSNFVNAFDVQTIKRYDRLIDKDNNIKYVNMSNYFLVEIYTLEVSYNCKYISKVITEHKLPLLIIYFQLRNRLSVYKKFLKLRKYFQLRYKNTYIYHV